MSKIKNIPNKVSEVIEVNRAQIEHRATWMGLIFDEMKKAGIEDAEQIIRRAIRRTGNIHGKKFYDAMGDKKSLSDFSNVFFGEVGVGTFNMVEPVADYDNATVDFKYCALVSAWQKLGFDDETCALLCDMAMDGDRAIAEAMGYKFDLGDTIAKGCAECKLHFHK